jgi:hypothetical protein
MGSDRANMLQPSARQEAIPSFIIYLRNDGAAESDDSSAP